MALNPTKLVSNKVKFVVNTGDDNNEKASQEHIETVEDPLVYDDPHHKPSNSILSSMKKKKKTRISPNPTKKLMMTVQKEKIRSRRWL
jgi:hypothetical protein